MNKKIIVILFMLSASAFAGDVNSEVSYVNEIVSYTTYNNGDVTFSITEISTQVKKEYWLDANDPGFKQNLAFLMLAKATESKVRIYANPNQAWPGGGLNVLKVTCVALY